MGCFWGVITPTRAVFLNYSSETGKVIDKVLSSSCGQVGQEAKLEFREAAQLLLVFYLKDLGVLDYITTLKAGPWRGPNLAVQISGSKQVVIKHQKPMSMSPVVFGWMRRFEAWCRVKSPDEIKVNCNSTIGP